MKIISTVCLHVPVTSLLLASGSAPLIEPRMTQNAISNVTAYCCVCACMRVHERETHTHTHTHTLKSRCVVMMNSKQLIGLIFLWELFAHIGISLHSLQKAEGGKVTVN
jgi:hypothetical protein